MPKSFLQFAIESAQRKAANPPHSVIHPGKQGVECLGSQPLVTVMKTANLFADSVFVAPNDSPQYFGSHFSTEVIARLIVRKRARYDAG